MDRRRDGLAPRQFPVSQTASASSQSAFVTSTVSTGDLGALTILSQTIPPAALTTTSTTNPWGFVIDITTELPQSALTTSTSTNGFGFGVAITTLQNTLSASSTSSDDSSTPASSTSASSTPASSTIASSSAASSTSTPAAQSSAALQNEGTTQSHKGISGGDIAAAVVVPIIVLIILLAAGFFFLRRRRRQKAAAQHTSGRTSRADAVEAGPTAPRMVQTHPGGSLTALPPIGAGPALDTPASTRTRDPFGDPSLSSASGKHPSSVRSASGGPPAGAPPPAASSSAAAGGAHATETIAELPGEPPAKGKKTTAADDDAASIDSDDFSFHLAEVADASQARKQRASVVQLSSGTTPPKSDGLAESAGQS